MAQTKNQVRRCVHKQVITRWFLLILIPLTWLVSCTPTALVMPTLAPVAVVPTIAATPTPVVLPTLLPTATIALPATSTSMPTPTYTPTPTPTPDDIPAYRVTDQIVSPFLQTPPGSVACDGTGVVFRSQFPSEYGGNRYYTVYLPPCYGQQGIAYPVLYLFHGSIQTDSHWVELGLPEIIDTGIQNGIYPPFIVIMPFNAALGNNTSGGEQSIEGITVDSLIPYVDAHYCTWAMPEGRGIGGISRGGYWALMIAFRHPDLFTSVSGHSSHLRYETDKSEYNPLSTYADADLSRMRIWLDWGETDFLYFGQKTLHELLDTAKVPHDAHVNKGGHNTGYWLAHVQEYLDWHAAAWPREPILSSNCGHP